MGYVTAEELYALLTLLLTVAGSSAAATLTIIKIVLYIVKHNEKKK